MVTIYPYDQISFEEIFERAGDVRDVAGAVAAIIAAVRTEGDAALRRYTKEFDKAEPEALEVPREALSKALEDLDASLRSVMEASAENIRAFHKRQLRQGFVTTDREGVVLGQRVIPLRRVGVYIPGGTAPLSSTVLMDVIPAKVAGCKEIIMASPPTCDGEVHPTILAAAAIAGVNRVFRCGGAQAIAALAYGTQSVPRVDKIVGPGNLFVQEAKRQVFGQVGIDSIAGPSEILVVADGRSDPVQVAADLLSQAEHGETSSAVLVTDDMPLAQAVQRELERQVERLPRREVARASLERNGRILVTENLEQAIEAANRLAPEHLELCVDRPFDYLPLVENAASVFLGRSCPEAVGDYFAGVNHTLPTVGAPRYASPLSADDFVKTSQFAYYAPGALARDRESIATFARAEGLEAHARSVESRFLTAARETPEDASGC